MNLKSSLLNLLKLAACGAVIAGIAGLFLILSEDGTVQHAEADLADFWGANLRPKPTFDDVMESSGLDPRPYDHNGNLVKSAVGVSELSPLELADYYQDAFVRAGINTKKYDRALFPERLLPADAGIESEEFTQQRFAMLNGEVVPLRMSEDHVAMGSIVPHKKTEDFEELVEQWQRDPHGRMDFDGNIAGFRFIEARREPGTNRSTVSASWSASNDFDARRHTNPETANTGIDASVPSCIGCTRVNRLAGLHAHENYILNQFETTYNQDITSDFYRRAMTERGWDLSQTTDILQRLEPHVPYLMDIEGEMLAFEKGERFLTIFQTPGRAPGITSVITMEGELP